MTILFVPGDLRAVNNNIIDMYSLKSLHGLVAAQVQSITRDEEGRFKVTVKDLISHSEVPGYMFFDITYDHVISCLGWKYINPEIFDDSIVMGKQIRKSTFTSAASSMLKCLTFRQREGTL